jgi:hypothetical protein
VAAAAVVRKLLRENLFDPVIDLPVSGVGCRKVVDIVYITRTGWKLSRQLLCRSR